MAAVMNELKIFVAQEPILVAACFICCVGLFVPAVVKPMLGSLEPSKQARQPALNDVVAGMTGKK
uniref:uncharacterized protein LOC122596706 n=1 Tax=Erigeron canadensis TaxID=72917 RepID=UPI001CB96D90|nr:uncharacterized protein LOC122596706 [Erigeron canadensis]XP_043625261.1 uncharacterized protein LOC122596706 [Erigeron canadensis]